MTKTEFFKRVDGIDKYRAVKDDSGPLTLFYLLIGVGGVTYSFNTNFMIWVNRKKIAQDVIIDLLEEERQSEKCLDAIKKSKLELVECQKSSTDAMKQYYSKSISNNPLLKYIPEREFLKMWAEEFRPAKEKEYMKQEVLLQDTLLSITKERHFLNQFI